MSAARPADLDPEHAFPKLTDAQIAHIRPFAEERLFADGQALWEQGERRSSMLVVLDGGIVILVGRDEIVTVHERGQFSGDIDLLSGHPVPVRGRARGATRALEVPVRELRALVQTDAELSAIFLRAFLLRRFTLAQRGSGNVVLIGSRHSAGTLELQEFLTRNDQPFQSLDVDRDPDVQHLLETFGVGVEEVPVLICRGQLVLKRPTIEEVAACLGLNELNRSIVRDLVVIGAGPAGLAAAVYGASEGLDVLVIESKAPGGQAGSSSCIENYLGFPTGIEGQKLASLALVQAEKFGAELAVARTAARLACERRPFQVDVGAGTSVRARAVIIATGVRYQKLDLPELARFEGLGVHYAATQVEANYCAGEEVVVVGGGNSAGQAAVFLSGAGRHVHMLVRRDDLASSMSRYLIRRIEETPNITLRTGCRLVALEGDGRLERVTWREADGRTTTVPVSHVFSMTGAEPNTAWLSGSVVLDEKGFVKTGPDLLPAELAGARWPLTRPPFLFETSVPGVFAAGDVRANSVKRVAAAVGEGSICVQLVHKALAA